MVSRLLFLLAVATPKFGVEAFTSQPFVTASTCPRISRSVSATTLGPATDVPTNIRFRSLKARGRGYDDDNYDDDEEDDLGRELVGARRQSGGNEAEMNAGDQEARSSSSRRYQDNVEFFDLDDDFEDDFEDEYGRKDAYEESYNGIIPNPL